MNFLSKSVMLSSLTVAWIFLFAYIVSLKTLPALTILILMVISIGVYGYASHWILYKFQNR